jgi:CubicO group peptidase (beta-lactamase class C family)
MRIFPGPLAAIVLLSSGIALGQTMVAAKAATVVETTSPVPMTRVQKHVFRPAYMTATKVITEETSPGTAMIAPKVRPTKQNVKLNTVQFVADLRAVLKDKTRGYALQLRKGGAVAISEQWGQARSSTEGNVSMSVNSRLHIASMSKLIASIATVKALEEKGLPWETKIGSYLPVYWAVGSNVADITFKDLMTQRAFAVPESSTDGCGCNGDYTTMKTVVANGVAATRERRYENVNFSILRVLDSILTGAVGRGSIYQIVNQPTASDAIWDIRTTDAFLAYVQAKVFQPAGVANVSPAPTGFGALAYASATDEKSWDSGDLATQLGGVGFRMSVKEYLDVMDAFRRKGTIVSPTKAQAAMDAGLGLDNVASTSAGKTYDKNGAWGTSEGTEQGVAFFLPEDMEFAVLVNSPLANGAGLRGTVFNAYVNNLE